MMRGMLAREAVGVGTYEGAAVGAGDAYAVGCVHQGLSFGGGGGGANGSGQEYECA